MTFRDRLIHAVMNRLFERRDIVIDGELYLRRWFLRGRGSATQWFLHNIRMPDAGRDLHDHPWDFTTKILLGGYIEEVETGDFYGRFNHKRGDEVRNMAEHTHRIAHVQPGTYTLMKTGPARRTWGFWKYERDTRWTSKRVWHSWREALGKPASEPDWPEDVIHPSC